MVPLPRLKALLAGFLVCLFLAGMLGLAAPRHEVYPFFSWFLFSEVPNRKIQYEVVIYSMYGKTYDPPLPIESIPRQYARGKFLNALRVSKHIALALAEGNDAAVKEQRALLESRYLPRKTGEYAIVAVETDPLEKWRNPGKSDYVVLARYRAGEDL